MASHNYYVIDVITKHSPYAAFARSNAKHIHTMKTIEQFVRYVQQNRINNVLNVER